ncbi:MAG: CrcB family protein [Actinomycetota bacterium]|nr:CrcB family protein [Actinomycetota bacterium]
MLTAIAAGGVVGAEARYGLSTWWPNDPGHWPGTTFVINVSGSLLLGALMVVLTELKSAPRLARPFLGVGVLGGFTTFSTAMVDVHELLMAGHPTVAMAYLFGSAAAALAGVTAGSSAVRLLATARRSRGSRGGT